MKCRHCGAKDSIEIMRDLRNGNAQYICENCGCVIEAKYVHVPLANPSMYLFRKLWVTPNQTFLKVKTLSGNQFYIKTIGTIYSQIRYIDFDTFEYEILKNSELDFKGILTPLLK